MSKHTEGTWNISKLATPSWAPEFGIYAGDSERDLARVMGPDAKANAHLIAAAPKLLLALAMIMDTIAFQFVGEMERNLALEALSEATEEPT